MNDNSHTGILYDTSRRVSQTTADTFRLDGPSYDELLNIITPTVAKRNNNMWEAVTLSQHLSFTLRSLANGRTLEDLKFFWTSYCLVDRRYLSGYCVILSTDCSITAHCYWPSTGVFRMNRGIKWARHVARGRVGCENCTQNFNF